MAYMENSLRVWKKRKQLSLAVIGFLVVMNVMVLRGFNSPWLG